MKIQWYEKPLMMPLRDIVKEYREAKYPKKQIDILADENHTKPRRIAWLLDRCGEDVDKTKLPRKSQKADAPDLDAIWRETPLGREAWSLNWERKKRIMEEKTMYKEADTMCPVELEENPVVQDEKTPESVVLFEGPAKNEGVVEETELSDEKSVTKSVKSITRDAEEEPDTGCLVDKATLAELITAEFWQIYLSHTFRPVNERDVREMLLLSDIAERLAE